MLAMSAAPSPSPTPAAANSASSADPQPAGTAAGGADGQTTATFATVLGHQVNSPTDKAATPAVEKKGAALTATDTPTDVPADAISMLASMLAGIAVTQPAVSQGNTDTGTGSQAKAGDGNGLDAATIIATAMPIAITGNPVTTVTAKTAATVGPVVPSAAAAADAKTALSTTAILAAEPAVKTEGSAETGKSAAQANSFESLLDAARATQGAAGDNAAVTATIADAAAAAATATHAAATAAHAAAATASAASPGVSAAIATPVGAQGWDHEVGEKLTWMVGRQETHAELVLNPPQLGRIEVSLSMNGDQASATFVSTNPAVRDALENAMPHLREMLQDAGISLGQTQVGAESFQQSADRRENGDNSWRGNAGNGDAGSSAVSGIASGGGSQAQWLRRGNGLVDTFA